MLFRWIALILVVRHLQCLHQLVAGIARHDDLVYEATLWAGDDPQRPPLALRLDYKRNLSGVAIAEASGQQSAASEEINHSIDDATQVAHQTAEAMNEAQKAVADLAVQARGLAELIVDMKH